MSEENVTNSNATNCIKENQGSFTKRIGNTHYIVQLMFDKTSKETLVDKTKKLILKEALRMDKKE